MATVQSNVIDDKLKADLDRLAKAGRILDLNGHSDKIFGHVSMRDPDKRGFWMKRHKISIGELWDHRDFVLVAFDGKKLFGDGDRHSEWPIHGKIYERRPDVNSVGHTHPFYGCIYSGVAEPLRTITGGDAAAAALHRHVRPRRQAGAGRDAGHGARQVRLPCSCATTASCSAAS